MKFEIRIPTESAVFFSEADIQSRFFDKTGSHLNHVNIVDHNHENFSFEFTDLKDAQTVLESLPEGSTISMTSGDYIKKEGLWNYLFFDGSISYRRFCDENRTRNSEGTV